jgi:hypothetical protein
MRFEGNVEDREFVRSVSHCMMQRISLLSRESSQRIRTSRRMPIPFSAGFHRRPTRDVNGRLYKHELENTDTAYAYGWFLS